MDKNCPFLAASPDGLINNDSIVEIKCPASIKNYTPEEGYENKKLSFMMYKDGTLRLKTTHVYYYQIQGQLHYNKPKVLLFFCLDTQR